ALSSRSSSQNARCIRAPLCILQCGGHTHRCETLSWRLFPCTARALLLNSGVRPRESLPEEPEPARPAVEPPPTSGERLKRLGLGRPKDLEDPHLFRHISLIAF